jgi:hypothetical protein
MHTQKIVGTKRHVFTRTLVASALIGATFLVGLATTASAAPPYKLVVITQPSATDASGAPLTQQPVVDIDNSGNTPDTGTTGPVLATITSGGVSVSGGSATPVNGVATFTNLALNALAGPYTLTFSDTADPATSAASNTVTVSVGVAAKLAFATPVPSGAIDTVALTPQPVVDVVDSGGNIVTSDNSSTVTATFTSTGTSLANATKTVTAGVATFSGLAITAPLDTSIAGLTFTDGALPTLLSGTIGITGPGTKLVIAQAPSLTATSGAALATQPIVDVTDASGAILKGDTSTVTATLVSGPVGSSISANTKIAVQGAAIFSGFAINAPAGSYSIIFSDGVLASATTVAPTVVGAGAAAKLGITTQPAATASAGAALSQQPVVVVQDSGGNTITSNTSTVTATLTPATGTVLNGTAVAVAGIATFSNLTLNAPAGPYTLTFTDGALTTAVSTTITVSAGAAAGLVVTVEPSVSEVSGTAMTIQPVVKIRDAGGNAILGNSSTVTATVTSAAGTVTNNTAVVSATTGLATFTGLTLNELVGPYTLTFSDPGLTSAVSTTITVSAGAAVKLAVTTQPSVTSASGAVLAQQPVVKVEDAAGNVIASDASTVTATLSSGGVSVTPATKVAVAGVATFTGFTVNAPIGAYTVTFSDGALTSAVSTSVAVTVGAPSQLVITSEPSASVATGVALSAQPVVKVEDTGGNVVTTVIAGAATAAITTGVGGTITAGATANFVAGVATFSDLTLTGTTGTAYTLTYSGDALRVLDTKTITVGLAQTVLAVTSVRATYGRTFALHTSGGSGTGALTYAVTNGSATGCSLSGATLKSATAGTCLVTATKANDATYAIISSSATTVTFAKLPIPGAVRIAFAGHASALSGAGRTQIIVLIRKLTTHAVVSITAYAKGNIRLARSRAAAADKYLTQRLHVKVQLHYNTSAKNSMVVLSTKSQ